MPATTMAAISIIANTGRLTQTSASHYTGCGKWGLAGWE